MAYQDGGYGQHDRTTRCDIMMIHIVLSGYETMLRGSDFGATRQIRKHDSLLSLLLIISTLLSSSNLLIY